MEATLSFELNGWEAISKMVNAFKIEHDTNQYNDEPVVNNHRCPKEKGKSATVEHYSIDDYKKLLDYFQNAKGNGQLHYLMLVLQSNTARRNSDLTNLKWSDLYDKRTGKFKDYLDINESKTGKYANPLLNHTIKKAVEDVIKELKIDPSDNDYNNFIFTQYTGKNKGEILSYQAYYRAIKRAAEKIGITYDVGTHSSRKFFGAMMYESHANEFDSKTIISDILNHSDEKITNRYIGLTKKRKDQYYENMGDLTEKIQSGELVSGENGLLYQKFVKSDITNLIIEAFEAGQNNVNKTNIEQMQSLSMLLSKVEKLAR